MLWIYQVFSFLFFSFSARRGRIYLPQDELARSGLSEDDIFKGKVTEKWRNFMKGQIKRARMFFDEAEKGVTELNAASRWPVCYVRIMLHFHNFRSPVVLICMREKLLTFFFYLLHNKTSSSLMMSMPIGK